MEIFFKGRVDIKFHSWLPGKTQQRYWTIAKPEEIQKGIRNEKKNLIISF